MSRLIRWCPTQKIAASPQDLTVGVLQQIHLNNIPIFQFAMFSSGNMEISCGQSFDITGPVHSNGHLYVEPDSSMKFESDVGAVLDVLFQRIRWIHAVRRRAGWSMWSRSTRFPPLAFLTLPIGATNTPEGVREIIEPAQPDDTAALSRPPVLQSMRYVRIRYRQRDHRHHQERVQPYSGPSVSY